jgi:4-amino-4-deoxy-L-arabinose transferase-like glycosyltransferase
MNIRLLGFLIALTVFRLIYIGQVGLVPDEAYYHEWGQRLDWWYFSKGPGVALAMKASTALFGHNEFGVRFFAPLLGLGTSLLIYWLAKRLYDARTAFWAAVVVSVTPIFNAGALLMTIDAPSIFFWTAALCTLWLALEKSPAFSGWWALSGVLIGIGWLFKMTNAVLLICVLLLLLLTPRRRDELLRPGFWSMLIAAAPFALPMVRWNAARGWPTTSHLAARGGLETPWWDLDWKSFFDFIAVHFGVYSPLIFLGMVLALAATVAPSFRRWGSALRRSIVHPWFVAAMAGGVPRGGGLLAGREFLRDGGAAHRGEGLPVSGCSPVCRHPEGGAEHALEIALPCGFRAADCPRLPVDCASSRQRAELDRASLDRHGDPRGGLLA